MIENPDVAYAIADTKAKWLFYNLESEQRIDLSDVQSRF